MRLVAAGVVAVCVTAFAGPAFAQLAPPNADGLTFGHVTLNVQDLGAHKKLWVEQFEGTLV